MPLTKAEFLLAACLTVAFSHAALCQDSESLGDVARQARQQKQDKDSQDNKDGNAAKAPKVITNEEISSGSHSALEESGSVGNTPKAAESHSGSESAKQSAESWRSQIQAQKQSIGSLEAEISQLNDSIQFAPANCVSGCVQWNERQQQKQQEVERMRSQLDTLKQHLQEMQEAARQQGYGSSVYDP